MAARMISCDLRNPGKADYAGLLAVIQGYDHVRLSESCYAVASDEYPKDIFERLEPFIDEDDNLAVIALSRFYVAHHDKAVLEWLDRNV